MGKGRKRKRPSIKKKKVFLLILTQAQVKMTRVQQSTAPGLKNTQVMYRYIYIQLWMYFWFLNFFSHTANMWNFETDVIERDAHVSLLRCKFLGYRESKEEKGDQGCSTTVVRYSMGNGTVTIFMGKGDPYFSSLKLQSPSRDIHWDHELFSNI